MFPMISGLGGGADSVFLCGRLLCGRLAALYGKD